MYQILLKTAFEKAEEELNTDKIQPRAKLLSDYILEDSREPYGEKSLRDKYHSVVTEPNRKIRLKSYVAESLSHYLEYKNYSDFIKNHNDTFYDPNNIRILIEKTKITIIIPLKAED
ncbi:hypothetical protein [Winogradskyella tangerina]|uniref:hypothetical protein n=1 Tax=Winogradskyella tangerina TaxID=2023240 RepID=UPI000DBE9C5D|nr:hypothetical protein [Winogradskyella tangerina]